MIRRRHVLAGALGLAGGPRPGRAATPDRLISVGGAVTETVFALGAGARVVAVDSTSRFPAAAAGLPQIGYMRALPPEGIVSLRPDLLLLSDEAGPPQAVAVLRAAHLPLAVIPDGAGADAAAQKIRAVAGALGLDGETMAQVVVADWHALDAALAAAPRPRALFVLSMARGAPLVSGRGTHADALIRAAGGDNPVGGFNGYRALSPEAAAEMAPEVIVMMTQNVQEAGGAAEVLRGPGLALTPAARTGRLIALDPTWLNFGPRAAQARRELAHLLHPGLALPELPERPWAKG